MKQRVQDLERQLCEMKTRHHQEQQHQQQQQHHQQQHQQQQHQQQHYFSPDLIPGDGSICFSPGAGCLPPPIWQHHSTTNTMSPDMWPSISSSRPEHQMYDASGVPASSVFPRNLPQHASYGKSTSHGQMHLARGPPMNQTPNIVIQADTELHQPSSNIGIYGEENGMGFTAPDQTHIDTGFACDATSLGQGKHHQVLFLQA